MSEAKYYAAMYLRLSKDDEDLNGVSKSESDSISNQRELLKSYIQSKPDIELYDIYIDDGYSGSNFDRPDFKRMTTDIEAGKVNCVIVKDLSRFGRDYVEAGRYIQKIYPRLGVRFIAVNDHYDSISADAGEKNIILPVKNFINDSYCRDISIKAKSGRKAKCGRGDFISPFAIYGYKKDEKDKGKLVIDEYAAYIVRNIFQWKIEGYSSAAIANRLNETGILSPAEYKKSKGSNYACPFSRVTQGKWTSKSVQRILTDRTYLGHLLQAKSERVSYKVKKVIDKPKEDWICAENRHEAIISEDDFEIVANLMQSDYRTGPDLDGIDLFSGLLYCGDCRQRMIRRIRKYKGNEKLLYMCSSANRGEGCSGHFIEVGGLKELIDVTVLKYIGLFLDYHLTFERVKAAQIDYSFLEVFDEELARLEKDRARYLRLKNSLTDELYKKTITHEEYKDLAYTFDQRIEDLEIALNKQRQMLLSLYMDGAASEQKLRLMADSLKEGKLDRYSMCSFVKRIYIYENGRVEVEFFVRDQFELMKKVCDHNTL